MPRPAGGRSQIEANSLPCEAAMPAKGGGDTLRPLPPDREHPMHETDVGKAVQLLDLIYDFFSDDAHWTRGCYDDGNGGHCLVGALLHLSRKHRLPATLAISLLQDAMPRPGLPLVHFNDHRCGSLAELRSVIAKARRLAFDNVKRESAAAAVKTWLLSQIEQKRTAAAASGEPFAPERLAA
jgi:hypothetical protein